ncbi:hypothetical protein [Nocardia rhamnosiphila]
MSGQVVVSIMVGMATAGVTGIFGWLTVQRAQYERVLAVIEHVSSDRVAEARDVWGAYIHSGRTTPQDEDERREIIRHLFTILWALGRIDAVRATLPAFEPWPLVKLCGPHTLLRSSTQRWVEYCVEHSRIVADQVGADIIGSDEGMENLRTAWRIATPSPVPSVQS